MLLAKNLLGRRHYLHPETSTPLLGIQSVNLLVMSTGDVCCEEMALNTYLDI